MRQAKTHATLNRTQRSQLRTAVKKVRSAAGAAAQTA
jgi:ribosomal protein S20